MKTTKMQFGFSQKLLTLAVIAAFAPAHAEEAEVAQLVRPESYVSAGLGAATGDTNDRAIFGQYNGLRENDSNLLLEFNFIKRDDTKGLWTNAEGHNLGLDNRELGFSQQKQGDWKYFVGYTEMVRHDPRTINTGLQNAETTTPVVMSLVTPGTGTDVNLKIKRKALSAGAEKWLTPNLMFVVSAKNEDRKGARLSGTGVACMPAVFSSIPCSSLGAAMLLLPEPIDSKTKQFELKLNYSDEKLMLSGGYYGSFFNNTNRSMNPQVSGNLVNPDGTTLDTTTTPGSTLVGYLQQPMALAPDNQAHQLYVSGTYAVTPKTRTTFKYAYTHATQNEDFGSLGAPAGVSNLGGVLDSNLVQLGLTARPMEKLSMLGSLRYEDKADKTPLALYNGAYTNDLTSSRKLGGKLEANYRLPDNYQATLGIDYASVHRDNPVTTADIMNITPPAISPLTGLREDTNELGYRAELRRSMSETINAALSYEHSKRDGGSWLIIEPNNTASNAVGTYPMTMLDRKRDKVKVSIDWTPIEKLSLQFMLEDGKDKYSAPSDKGLRDTGMSSYGVDAALILSESWKLTGYLNQNTQTVHVDHNVGYMAELENINTSLGLGVIGKPLSKIEIGGDLSYLNDDNRYQQSMATGAPIVGGGLPDVTYRVTRLKLYGEYALEKSAVIHADMVYQSAKINEWTWGNNGIPFTYSDNATVSMQQNQNLTFLGFSYVYKFR